MSFFSLNLQCASHRIVSDIIEIIQVCHRRHNRPMAWNLVYPSMNKLLTVFHYWSFLWFKIIQTYAFNFGFTNVQSIYFLKIILWYGEDLEVCSRGDNCVTCSLYVFVCETYEHMNNCLKRATLKYWGNFQNLRPSLLRKFL